MPTFVQRLQTACSTTRSLVCVGLDPDPEKLPVRDVAKFNRAIVGATASWACAYKPNLGFYEALGLDGWRALESTIASIRELAPAAVIIGDAKRGDIGPSAEAYARAMFGIWDFDAVTLNAWGGHDSVAPFLTDADRGGFIWCRGSNPGSADLQDTVTETDNEPVPLYRRLAQESQKWNSKGNLGLVVGATAPEQLADVRRICPDMPLLIPGVGAQGGDLEASVRYGVDQAGRMAVINSSRDIIYASPGPDFAEAAGRAAQSLRDAINRELEAEGLGWP